MKLLAGGSSLSLSEVTAKPDSISQFPPDLTKRGVDVARDCRGSRLPVDLDLGDFRVSQEGLLVGSENSTQPLDNLGAVDCPDLG